MRRSKTSLLKLPNMATAGMGAAILENENPGDKVATSGMPVNLPGQLQNYVVYCGSFLEPTFL